MFNKLFTLFVALLMLYTLMKQPNNIIPTNVISENKEKKNELIEKIKMYAELLSANPKELSLTDKNTPLIVENSEGNQVSEDVKENPSVIHNYSINPQEKNPSSIFQDKISNVMYNILKTKQGQAILDKILVSDDRDNGKDKKTSKKNPYKNNSILNVVDGEGEQAECGDIVSVHYITRLVSGQEIETTRLNNKPKTFQVGNGDVIKGIEYAVIGMKKGGIRRLITPPRLAYSDSQFSKNLVAENEFITIDIELMDLKPALSDWKDKITILKNLDDDRSLIVPCGNKIFFSYNIADTNEKILAKSNKIENFTLGSSEVPAAINKAFSDIGSHSKRIVMIPSSLIYKKPIKFLPDDTKLPEKAMLIFSIDTGYDPNEIKKEDS